MRVHIQNHHFLLGAYICCHVRFEVQMILVLERMLRNFIMLLTFPVIA